MSYVRGALATTYNIIANAATRGRYVWLAGRVRKGVFSNWAKRFCYRPKKFVQPVSEQEIVECQPSDDLFRAAIGGLGAVGIIVEVVVQGVDRFNVEQKVRVSHL